jgi:hypothetical protein
MKKVIILGVFILLGAVFVPSFARADLPPGPDQNYLDFCSKIVNINEFPDLVFIGYNYGPTGTIAPYIISNDECLKGGYKFGSVTVFYITKDKFNSIDLKNLKMETVNGIQTPTELTFLMGDIQFYGGYVYKNTHIKAETVEYKIIKTQPNLISISKYRKITEYDNDTPNKVETFSSSDVKKNVDEKKNTDDKIVKQDDTQNNDNIKIQEPPKPVKRGFWRSILCFFGFSKSC